MRPECYLLPSGMPGSWFCLGFHEQPRISTLSALSHNATGQTVLKKTKKTTTVSFPWTMSLDTHAHARAHTHGDDIFFHSNAKLICKFKPNSKASSLRTRLSIQETLKRYILKTLHEIRHSNFSLSWMLSVCREVETDEAVQVALSTSALSQCFKGRGWWKQVIWAVW